MDITQQMTSDMFGSGSQTNRSRETLLEHGQLIDITESAADVGIRVPTAVTQAVWQRYIEWGKDDTDNQIYQDQSVRLKELIWMARSGLIGRDKGNASQTLFEFDCVPRDGESKRRIRTTLLFHIDGREKCEPVVTIKLQNED